MISIQKTLLFCLLSFLSGFLFVLGYNFCKVGRGRELAFENPGGATSFSVVGGIIMAIAIAIIGGILLKIISDRKETNELPTPD